MKNEIIVSLDEIIERVLPEAIEKGLERAGQIVENSAKQKCGVDTGTLRKSITHDVEGSVAYIGSNVEYAPYHHNNNPFLEDALMENLPEIQQSFEGVLDGAE